MDNQAATKFILPLFASLARFYMNSDGSVSIVDEGAIPLDYDEVKKIKEIVDMYLSQGEENCNELRKNGIEEYWKPKTRINDTPSASRSGYLYLVKSGDAYKIGITKSPQSRIKSLENGTTLPVETICIISTNDRILLEKQLHQRFDDKRLNGEWFDLAPEDVNYIKGLVQQ